MNINFSGLVDLHTLPATEPLLPLFEAVANSIQSINQNAISLPCCRTHHGCIRLQ